MSARAWTGFATLSILWGVPYLFIKVAVDGGMSPACVAWVRVVLAAAILLTLAARAGVLSSVRGHWRWLAVYALVEITIPFPLIATGEQHVTSSLAAILIAAVPLFVALLAIRFDHAERATGRRLVGLLIGLAGVVVLMGIDVAGKPDELLGAAAIIVAALGYAVGPMVLKRKFSHLDPRAAMGTSLAIAGRRADPVRRAGPAAGGAERRRAGLAGGARHRLHRARVRRHGRAGHRDRAGPRARHHLRQPGRRGRSRRGGARRAAGRGRRRRAAADHRRLVALDRRPPAAGPGGARQPAAARALRLSPRCRRRSADRSPRARGY